MASYLFEVSMYWLASWALYHFLLGRERFFQLNRLYLLSTLVLALAIPLVEWSIPVVTPEWVGTPVIWLEEVTVGQVAATVESAGWTWQDVLLAAYVFGCALALGRLLWSLHLLVRQIHFGRLEERHGIRWVRTTDPHTPYSWFGYLFWSDALQLDQAEENTILAHERAHIRQGHSYDILLVEIIGLFFWWNPLWYFYRKAVRDVHEYLADAVALRQTPVREYGHLLIRQSLGQPSLALIQNFHTSQLKQRIAMMTKQPSRPGALLKYLLLLPLGALIFFACNEAAEKEVMQEVAEAVDYRPAFQMVDTVITFDASTYEETLEIVKSDVYEEVEEMPIYGTCGELTGDERKACSGHNLITRIGELVKYPDDAWDAEAEGMALIKFVVDTDGRVANAEVAKSTDFPSLDAEALRAVRALSEFQPGQVNGKAVHVQLVLPIRFKMQ